MSDPTVNTMGMCLHDRLAFLRPPFGWMHADSLPCDRPPGSSTFSIFVEVFDAVTESGTTRE